MFKGKYKKMGAWLVSLSLFAVLAAPAVVFGQVPVEEDFGLQNTDFQNVGVNSDQDIRSVIASIINIILGFLGIIAVIIILAGGFKWMTAGGNEDSVAAARQMIIQGIIGLVVIFAAWAIASFVVSQLQNATNITT